MSWHTFAPRPVHRWFFALFLCFCLAGLGCPMEEPQTDEGEPETDCTSAVVVGVDDEMGMPACSDTDGQTGVLPPAEAQASCSAQVSGSTVTSSGKTGVEDSVASASCSFENGGECSVSNSCTFVETEARDYTFTLDAAVLAEGQAPQIPDGSVVQGTVSIDRVGGGTDIFTVDPGEQVDVQLDVGDGTTYFIIVDSFAGFGEDSHVLGTFARDSVGGACVDDGDCENPFYAHCQPGGSGTGSGAGTGSGVGTGTGTGSFSCGAGVFPNPCADDTDCSGPNYVCVDDQCDFALDDGDVCDGNDDCDGDSLCDEFGVCRSGRAVLLDNATGTIPAGSLLCLSNVGFMGCVFTGSECEDPLTMAPALHLHRSITITGETGPGEMNSFPDPNGSGCGHGRVVGDPDCGEDTIPDC